MGDASMNDYTNGDRRKPSKAASARSPLQDVTVRLDRRSSDCFNKGLFKKSCFRVASDQDSVRRYPGELVTALNVGGSEPAVSSSGIHYSKDQTVVLGGDLLRTDEKIRGTTVPSLYQTARYGNGTYKFLDLLCGEYFVDLHFAEIVFTNGPSGMRVFDVYIQDEKVIAGLDVYSQVGSNKALIFCCRATVSKGTLLLAFKGFIGNPTISAICFRRSSLLSPTNAIYLHKDVENIEPKVSKKIRKRATDNGGKLEELKKECRETWISLQEANRKIEKLQMDATSKSLTLDTLVKEHELLQREYAVQSQELEYLYSNVLEVDIGSFCSFSPSSAFEVSAGFAAGVVDDNAVEPMGTKKNMLRIRTGDPFNWFNFGWESFGLPIIIFTLSRSLFSSHK